MPEPMPSPPLAHIRAVYSAYVSLFAAAQVSDSLGGRLLYGGNLDETTADLIRAANIAGAASLSTSSDAAALRQAMRDGVIDFLVNSLDEALRILKNEIRKKQPVSVAISLDHKAIAQEMLQRGVLPDLLPHTPSAALAEFEAQGATRLAMPVAHPPRPLQIWQIPIEYTNRVAGFEAILASHLSPEDHTSRRWLHLSPRYLAHAVRRLRSLPMDEESKEKLAQRFGLPLPS